LEEDPAKNSDAAGVYEFSRGIPTAEQERFTAGGNFCGYQCRDSGIRELHEFLVKDLPAGRGESIGMSELPDGKAWLRA